MKKFMKVMKALSDKNRLKIIKMLQHKEMLCVCEIQSGLGLAQSTVSKHLKLLEDAELVIYEKDGLWVNYSLNYKPDNPYSATMLGNLRCWLEGEHEIVELKKKLPGLDRAYICN
ncbi:MAG: transcriptional regulator [Desulfobacteraceae bacterium 4572_88]|nr:MAG: transcriptional regulator [Desulfobacteraceae bacterium 4572_88]